MTMSAHVINEDRYLTTTLTVLLLLLMSLCLNSWQFFNHEAALAKHRAERATLPEAFICFDYSGNQGTGDDFKHCALVPYYPPTR